MEWEWNAHGTQIRCIEADAKKSQQEVLSVTNHIEELIIKNNCIFVNKWELTHHWIDCWVEDHCFLVTHVWELESLSGLQQTALQHCQDTVAGLEETVTQLVATVKKLEKSI